MTLHGIVTCDTVRKARAWLDAQRVAYEFVDLRRSPPSPVALSRWSAAVGWEVLLNRRGTTWRKLDPTVQKRVVDAASAMAVMIAHPSCIRRPVVEAGGCVLAGFDAREWDRLLGTRASVFGTGAAAPAAYPAAQR